MPSNRLFETSHGRFWTPILKVTFSRLLYECNPASFIMEQSGGLGSNGEINVVDITPETIHDRTQVFLGAKEEIDEIHNCLRN